MAKIVQLFPATDKSSASFTDGSKQDGYFYIPLLCWALQDDGTVVGLVFKDAKTHGPERYGREIVSAQSFQNFKEYVR